MNRTSAGVVPCPSLENLVLKRIFHKGIGIDMMLGNANSACLSGVLLACVVATCGCGPSSGYTNIDGDWCYVLLRGIGDAPIHEPLHADNETFQVFSPVGYAKDRHRVFYQGRAIEGAHSATFHVDDDEYARDQQHVYFQGVIVQRANPATFRILAYPYGKDDKLAFCGTLPMTVDDVGSFRVIKPGVNTHSSVAGSDSLGYLDNYHEELDPKLDLVYGTQCRARTDNQKFQGPIRVE